MDVTIVIDKDTTVEASTRSQSVSTLIIEQDGVPVKFVFDTWELSSIEAGLAFLEQLEANVDNMVSALRLRQQDRERAQERTDLGGGAGASVEAYRG